MKISLRITRKTEYATIVEMSQEEYNRLSTALHSEDRWKRRDTEKTLNKMIDEKDWQDDDFLDVDEFEPLETGEASL